MVGIEEKMNLLSNIRTYYMDEDGKVSLTLMKCVDGVRFQATKEDYHKDEVEEVKKVDRIVEQIEEAAKIRGIKKFAVGDSFWTDTPPEYLINRIAKAVDLAEQKGYKFVGGITTADQPVMAFGKIRNRRWCFIEFEETVKISDKLRMEEIKKINAEIKERKERDERIRKINKNIWISICCAPILLGFLFAWLNN